MGRKDRKGAKDQVQNRELFERVNFLYQATNYLTSISATSPADSAGPHVQGLGAKYEHDLTPLARFYSKEMTAIARKNVMRIDPTIKRTICKRCQTLLVPGRTAHNGTIGTNPKRVRWQCNRCGYTRSYMLKSMDKPLFTSKPEHQLLVLKSPTNT